MIISMNRIRSLILFLLVSSGAHAQFIVNQGQDIKNNTQVVVNGDWTNTAGSAIFNNGIIRTSASFTNSGTLDAASSGGFELTSTTDVVFTPGGAGFGFFRKSGNGAVALTGTIHVRDSLILTRGIINLSAGDTIVIGKGARVTANSSGFVNGMLAHTGTGELFFPLGDGTTYLPMTLYKVQAAKVTASIIPTPAGISAGPGIDSLINFPYAWKVVEKTKSDTAAYVELAYPTGLPDAAHPIVVRTIPGNKYASMGARFIDKNASQITVRSYSRGLHGIFSIAAGFPVDATTDSLALVALYQSTNGASWTNKTNWLSGDVDTWFGVTKTGQNITGVQLSNNNLTGELADPFVDIGGLQTINLSQNKLTAIPDFTANAEINSLDVSQNNLTFASLEPNASVPGLHYVNQGLIGNAVDSLVEVNDPYTLSIDAGGTATTYQWKRNGVVVQDATSGEIEIAALRRDNMGEYVLQATNPLLPALTLTSEKQNILAYATITGTLMAGVNDNATAGEMTLYRIQPAAFEKITPVSIENDGTFVLDKVILDDYQLLGFADTLLHPSAIPTYYKNTIFWEEADTLFVEDNITDLSIVSTTEPGPPSGRGLISGVLLEDDGTGGRAGEVKKPKKVQDAGVTARRVERGGRGKEEILTLVSYVFTNEEGEFALTNLPEGEYRLNIQYPGYPMDTTSFVTIVIGSGLQSQVAVEANVVEGKINVRKLTITGIYQAEDYQAELYPNPAVESIHLKFGNESAHRSATLSDIQGKAVLQQKVTGKEEKIVVEGLTKGIYLLQILEKGKIAKTVKVSIE
jgi:hypothetical protein